MLLLNGGRVAVMAFAVIGAMAGAFLGVVFVAMSVMTGGVPARDGSVISPISAVAMYVVAAGVGGALAGALRSLLGSVAGTMLVGAMGTMPLLVGAAGVYERSFLHIDWLFVLAGSILIGMPMGYVIRREYRLFHADAPGT
jgi:hypothetical protein